MPRHHQEGESLESRVGATDDGEQGTLSPHEAEGKNTMRSLTIQVEEMHDSEININPTLNLDQQTRRRLILLVSGTLAVIGWEADLVELLLAIL